MALRVEDVAHAFGSNRVLRNVSLTLERGQRLAVIGRNGAGKSTLLNIAAGVLQPDRGSAEVGHNVAAAHFTHALDPALARRTSYAVVRSLLGPDETTIRSFLATLMFREDHIFRPLRTLSAGERARLSIARLMPGAAQPAAAGRAEQQPGPGDADVAARELCGPMGRRWWWCRTTWILWRVCSRIGCC